MKFSRERIRFFVEIGAVCAAIACLGAALAGDEWFDVVGADLSDSGFGTNLSLHGGVFQSCGPPIDPNSTKEEECFKFEEILGPYTPLQLLQIRGFLAFTLLMLVMGLFCGSKYAVEFYFLAFAGVVLAFSIATAMITTTGILVCNCLDELGIHGWLATVQLPFIIIALFAAQTKKRFKMPIKNIPTLMSFAVLGLSLATLGLDWFDTSAYLDPREKYAPPEAAPEPFRPTIFPPSESFIECEKRYSLTAYCVGFCSDQGGFRWECVKWESFLQFENSWNTANWRTPTPFAIRLAWLYIGLVVPGLVAQIVIQQRTTINPLPIARLNLVTIMGLYLVITSFSSLQDGSNIIRGDEVVNFGTRIDNGPSAALCYLAAVAQLAIYVMNIVLTSQKPISTKNNINKI